MGIRALGNTAVSYAAKWLQTDRGASEPSHKEEIIATGGTTATPGDGYKYHLFSPADPGNFVVTAGNDSIDVIVVGGGGGGGYDRGGGGGAGAFRPFTVDAVPGTHPITTGAGGSGAASGGGPVAALEGANTTFVYDSQPYIANGGAGGSSDSENASGGSNPGNGSGGGTTGSPVGSAPWPGGAGGDFGNPGKGSTGNGTGGGGGGAGSGGPDAPQPSTSTTAFIGGDGATLPWIPTSYGVSGYFAGGGGGGGYQYPSGTEQSPIPGGGGRGGCDPTGMNGEDGTAKTGSGGGGGRGSGTRNGGNGAPSCVLIRYSA